RARAPRPSPSPTLWPIPLDRIRRSGDAPAAMRLPEPASDEARALARTLSMSITAADVLVRRGHRGDEATRRYLDPRLSHLTAPHGMADRAKATERIVHALRKGER